MRKLKYFSLLSFGLVIPISTILVASCSSLDNNVSSTNNVNNQNTKIISKVNSSQIGWQNKTKIDIYQQYNSSTKVLNNNVSSNLNHFIFQNLNTFIQGDVSLITQPNLLEAKLENWNDIDLNSLTITLTIKAKSWYLNNEVQNKSLVQKVQINNLKEIPNWIDSKGGNIDSSNKLYANKYAEVLKVLEFNYSMPIWKLNDDILNNKLHQINKFNKLNLTVVADSSTSEGKLILNLKGSYETNLKQQINVDDQITITGFLKVNNNLDLSIQNFKTNLSNWFIDGKPVFENKANYSQITSINMKEWLEKYIEDFNVYSELNNWTMKEFLNYGFKFKTFNSSITNDFKKIKFTLDGSYINKKYDGQKWNDDFIVYWKQNNFGNNSSTLNIPNLDETQNWLINQIQVDANKLNKYYPSFFLGLESLSESINNNDYYSFENYLTNKSKDIIANIQNNYFLNEQIKINLNNGIRANDFENHLSFSLFLKIGTENRFKFIKHFSFNNIFNNNLDDLLPKNNLVLIKPLNAEKNNWFSIIMKFLKNKHKKSVEDLFQSQDNSSIQIIEQNTPQLILPSINNKSLINNGNWPNEKESVIKNLDTISKHISPKIFNKELKISLDISSNPPNIQKNSFDYESKLYNFFKNSNNLFHLNDVRYVFEKQTIKINLTKIQSSINIDIKGETSISFADGQFRNYPTDFVMVMIRSDWNS